MPGHKAESPSGVVQAAVALENETRLDTNRSSRGGVRVCIMRQLTLIPTVLVFLVLGSTGRAMAYLSAPVSWRQVSDDGQYVLVMVRTCPSARTPNTGTLTRTGSKRSAASASRYSESGLYRNDGSTTPLWNIQYFSRPQRGDVYIAPDGEHLIFGADGFFAGWFFAHGRRLAGYTVDDLVSHKLVKSMMSFRVPTCLWDHFDADSMTYTVHTNQGEEFTFDATTGGLIGASRPGPLTSLRSAPG